MAENPYANKVNFGDQTLLDLTSDTVTPADVRSGVTFHDKAGERKVGSLSPLINGLYNQRSNNPKGTIKDNSVLTQTSSILQIEAPRYAVFSPSEYDINKADYTLVLGYDQDRTKDYNLNIKILNGSKLKRLYVICTDNGAILSTVNGDFSKCNLLEEVYIIVPENKNVIFSSIVSSGGIFENSTSLKKLIVASGIVLFREGSVDSWRSFKNCVNLEYVRIPGVESIEEAGFFGCTSLKDIIIPDETRHIKIESFANCTSLDLTIPDSVTTIGTDAFLNVPHITYHGPATGAPWGALSMN